MSEQLQIFSATGPNTVFLCCPVRKFNGRAEKISALGLWGVVRFDTGGHLPLWSFAQVRSAAISRNLHSLCVDLLALQKPFV